MRVEPRRMDAEPVHVLWVQVAELFDGVLVVARRHAAARDDIKRKTTLDVVEDVRPELFEECRIDAVRDYQRPSYGDDDVFTLFLSTGKSHAKLDGSFHHTPLAGIRNSIYRNGVSECRSRFLAR